MNELQKFIAECNAWADRHGLSQSKAGELLAGSPSFLHDINRRKREPRFSTIYRIRKKMQLTPNAVAALSDDRNG